MSTRSAVAIDLGRRRLRAVQAGVARGRLLVRRTLVLDTPADLNPDDPKAVGDWVGNALREAGIPRGPAVIAIGREHVGLKRITLPTTDPDELPDMTRLALQRELPFDAESAVIDFVPVEQGESSTTVLAVAAPRRLIDHTVQWAAEAGLKIERIALRTTGCAALLKSMGDSRSTIDDSPVRSKKANMSVVMVQDVGGAPETEADQPAAPVQSSIVNRQSTMALLGIDVVGEGVEFCVVADGSIRFSRAAEVPAPQDQLAMADAVVTEARRTWMSYRAADDGSAAGVAGGSGAGDGGAIASAYIMGDRRVAEYAAGPLGQMLKIPVQVLREHPRVDSDGDARDRASGPAMDRVWPLAGMLLEGELRIDRIDFLQPRRAPDVAARTRQRRLLAAAALVVVRGGLWTAMRFDLRSLRDDVDRLAAQAKANIDDYDRANRDRYKLTHLKQWDSISVDWLEHAKFLAEVAPPPEKIVLDSWSGALDFRGVTFDSRNARWAADHQTTIVIEGEARDRATADGFRESLTQNTIYTTSTTGADTRGGKRMPFGFTYRLRTRAPAPAGENGEQQQAAAAVADEVSAQHDRATGQAGAGAARDDGAAPKPGASEPASVASDTNHASASPPAEQ